MRFKDEKRGGWVEIEPMTSEQVQEIRGKNTHTFIAWPDGRDGVRIEVADGEEVIEAKRVYDKNDQVSRVDVKTFNTYGFGQDLYLGSVKDLGGFKDIKNNEKGKLELFKDLGFVTWVMGKIREAQKVQIEKHGSDSAEKNS